MGVCFVYVMRIFNLGEYSELTALHVLGGLFHLRGLLPLARLLFDREGHIREAASEPVSAGSCSDKKNSRCSWQTSSGTIYGDSHAGRHLLRRVERFQRNAGWLFWFVAMSRSPPKAGRTINTAVRITTGTDTVPLKPLHKGQHGGARACIDFSCTSLP